MPDPADVQRLTRHYPFMRGLVFLPFWLGFGVVTVFNGLGWTRTASWEEMSILTVSLTCTLPLSRYYDRRFGVVRPLRSAELSGMLPILLVIGVVVLALQFIAVAQRLPVEPVLLAMAGFCFFVGFSDRGFRLHWLVPAVACLALSMRAVLPLDRATSHIAFGVVYSSTVAFAHIWDHVLLVRSFRHVHS